MSLELYRQLYEETVRDPEGFWSKVAAELVWYRKWDVTLDGSNPPFYRWFV